MGVIPRTANVAPVEGRGLLIARAPPVGVESVGDKTLIEEVETHVAPPGAPPRLDEAERSTADPRFIAAPVTRVQRVAILGSRGIPARYGGFETFAEELATRLVREPFRVTVFCERERESGLRRPRHEGVDLAHVRTLPVGPFRTILFDVMSLIRALRGFDVIYMLGYGAAWAFWIPRFFGVPLVEEGLALQIAQLDDVAIDEHERTHAAAHQGLRE